LHFSLRRHQTGEPARGILSDHPVTIAGYVDEPRDIARKCHWNRHAQQSDILPGFQIVAKQIAVRNKVQNLVIRQPRNIDFALTHRAIVNDDSSRARQKRPIGVCHGRRDHRQAARQARQKSDTYRSNRSMHGAVDHSGPFVQQHSLEVRPTQFSADTDNALRICVTTAARYSFAPAALRAATTSL